MNVMKKKHSGLIPLGTDALHSDHKYNKQFCFCLHRVFYFEN